MRELSVMTTVVGFTRSCGSNGGVSVRVCLSSSVVQPEPEAWAVIVKGVFAAKSCSAWPWTRM